MSSSSAHVELRSRREPKPRLCVVLGCHQIVCALPIEDVDRLVLPESVQAVEYSRTASGLAGDGRTPLPDVVRVGEKLHAAWDLGVMFGLRPISGAWVLLSQVHEGAPIWLALRTGPCFAVQTLRNLMPFPGGNLHQRQGALTNGFATSAVAKERLDSSVGVLVDPRGLWTQQELQASAAVLAAVDGARSGER